MAPTFQRAHRRLFLAWHAFALTAVASLQAHSKPSENLLRVDLRTVVVDTDITSDITFDARHRYVIVGEVHVAPGVTVYADDGATILIRNGVIEKRELERSALLFEPGSRLVAKSLTIKAADEFNRVERKADNGGVWFLGTYASFDKDGIARATHGRTYARSNGRSWFEADTLTTSYLGAPDPMGTSERKGPSNRRRGDDDSLDDLDAISVMGVSFAEWNIRAVVSEFSGDDGFDVTNSRIALQSLTVRSPTEDALNISSSRVDITHALDATFSQAMPRGREADRHLFDLEVDDGPAFVAMGERCDVTLSGYFGTEVALKSTDMPEPDPLHRSRYEYNGQIRNEAIVYSIAHD